MINLQSKPRRVSLNPYRFSMHSGHEPLLAKQWRLGSSLSHISTLQVIAQLGKLLMCTTAKKKKVISKRLYWDKSIYFYLSTYEKKKMLII